jgi:hypothetical protein
MPLSKKLTKASESKKPLDVAVDTVKEFPGKAKEWASNNQALAITGVAGVTALAAAALIPLLARLRGKGDRRATKGRREGRFVKRAVDLAESEGFGGFEDALNDEAFYAILEELADAAAAEW